MAQHPNEWYLQSIKEKDNAGIKAIYQEFLPMIVDHVRKNSGGTDDAKDIFADALMSLLDKFREEELVLTCQFSTYLFQVCKNLWNKKLRRKKFDAGVTPEELQVSNVAEEMDPILEKTERHQLLREKFAKLSEDCRLVLDLAWHSGKSMQEVGEAMGWTYAYVRKRKSQCKSKLIESIKADARFHELKNQASQR